MHSKIVQGKRKCEIQDISIIKFVADLGYYLGFLLVQGRVSRTWNHDGLSRTWNHVNWNMVTTPKRFGGLGICEARLTNLTLLGKLV